MRYLCVAGRKLDMMALSSLRGRRVLMPTPEEKERITDRFAKLIARLERQRKSRIYSMVQTEGTDHICSHTLRTLLQDEARFSNLDTLELLIVSGWGHPDIAYKLTRFMQGRCKRLNAIVPLYAKSSATLMFLGAQEIFMGEGAEFGPIDIQIADPVERGDEQISPLDEFKSMEFSPNDVLRLVDFFPSRLRKEDFWSD